MGNSKGSNNNRIKSTYISPKSLLYINDDFTPAYSTFYHFTRWITTFNFFTKITDNDDVTRLIVMKDGPNDYNIYQIIKAIDELEPKNIINEFSFCDYFDMNSVEEDADNGGGILKRYEELLNQKNPIQSVAQPNNHHNMLLTQKEVTGKVFGLIDTLFTSSRKKFDKILMKGSPNNLRWFMWMCLALEKYKSVEEETGITNEELYNTILKNKLNKEIETNILQNLQLCVQAISYYLECDKVDHLYNLLRAIALYDKDIGYNRIINKIAGYVLIVSNFNEAEAFLMIRYILSSDYGLGIRELILENRSKTIMFNYIMRFFIEERMPNINDIINEYNIQNKLWFATWVQSLFIDKMPFNVCIRIWDCLFVKGLSFFYNYILGLIKHYENDLIDSKDENEFIGKFDIQLNYDDDVVLFREKFINLSEGFTITSEMINEITEKYYASSQATDLNIVKNNKEIGVIMKIAAQCKREARHFIKEKEIIEYDPEMLSLNDLEVNEEGHLANKSSTDDEIAIIDIKDEYINTENEQRIIYDAKKHETKTPKSIKSNYSLKQNKIRGFKNKKFAFKPILEEDNNHKGIRKDDSLSDISLEES